MLSLTRTRFKAAFTAWQLAIEEQISNPDPTKSIEELAEQFGKSITNTDDLEIVAACFDWDKVCLLLEEVSRA